MYANRSATKYATFHFFCSEVHDYAERRVKLVKDASVRFILNNQDCVAVKCQTLLLVKIKTKLQESCSMYSRKCFQLNNQDNHPSQLEGDGKINMQFYRSLVRV